MKLLLRISMPAVAGFFAALGLSVSFAAHGQASPGQVPAPHFAGPVLVTMFHGKFDTREAKIGDTVTLKVRETLKLNGLEIPSGSMVVGKVQNVRSLSQGGGKSLLAIQFEKIDMKPNREMRIRGLIVAIGQTYIADGLGYGGALSREGVGWGSGVDPNLSAGHQARDDVGFGSSLPGVALAEGLDKQQASEMRGIKTDIKLDSMTMVKIELFRPPAA